MSDHQFQHVPYWLTGADMQRGLRQPPPPRSAGDHYTLCCRPPPSCYGLCCWSACLCCTQTKSSNPASSVCQRPTPAAVVLFHVALHLNDCDRVESMSSNNTCEGVRTTERMMPSSSSMASGDGTNTGSDGKKPFWKLNKRNLLASGEDANDGRSVLAWGSPNDHNDCHYASQEH